MDLNDIFTDDVVNRIRQQRRARRGQAADNTIGALLGVEARDAGTYMTPAQKAAQQAEIMKAVGEEDRFYFGERMKFATAKMQDLTDRYKALASLEGKRLEQSTESAKLAARLATQAHDLQIKRLDDAEQRAANLDPVLKMQLTATIGTAQMRLEEQVEKEIEKQIETLSNPQMGQNLVRAKGFTGDPEEARVATLQALQSKEGRDVAKDQIRRKMLTSDLPAAKEVQEVLRQGVEGVLRPGVDPEQAFNAINMLGAELGVNGTDVAKQVGYDVNALAQTVAEARQTRLQQMEETLQKRVEASRRTYGSDAGIDSVRQEIEQAIATQPSLPSPSPGGGQRAEQPTDVDAEAAGGGAPGAGSGGSPGPDAGGSGVAGPPGDDPAEMYYQGVSQESDARKRLMGIYEGIERMPDKPQSQYLQQQLMASPEYAAFKEHMGYEGFDDKKVWKEFVSYGKEKMAEQDLRFKAKRRLNEVQLEKRRDHLRGSQKGGTEVYGATMRASRETPDERTS